MLGRCHFCLFLACTMLTAGLAHAQYHYPPPPPGGGVYDPDLYPAPQRIDPGLMQELLPANRGGLHWDTPSPFERALRQSSYGAFLRVEYLNSFFRDPGRGLLGAPLAAVPDPRQPFTVATPAGAILNVRVPDVSSVSLENVNGIRITGGFPLRFGLIETSYWATEQERSTILAQDVPRRNPLNPVDAIATSVFTNGAPGSTVILHDEGFRAPYTAQLWGLESNFLYSLQNPELGLRVMPLIGFRYTDYDETLAQQGTFTNTSDANPNQGLVTPPLVRRINSNVDNNLYYGQLGLRMEFAHQLLTVGVEPKLGVGINHYEAIVRTADLRNSPFPPVVDDPATRSRLARDATSALFDFQTYATVHVNRWLNLRVGWTYTWMGSIARANHVIHYNDNGIANPPAIGTKTNTSSLWMSTLSVGGEIVLP